MILNKLKNRQKNNASNAVKRNPINLGLMAINYLRQSTINGEATKTWKINGINSKDKKFLDKVFYKSEFTMQRHLGTALLFDEGYFIATTFVYKDSPIIKFSKVVNWEKLAGEVIYAYCEGSDFYTVNNTQQTQILKYYYKNGSPRLEYGYVEGYESGKGLQDKDAIKFVAQKIYKFEGTKLPIEIIPNLHSYKGDIEHFCLSGIINEIERESNWIGPEFDLIKNNVLLSRNGEGSKGAEYWEKRFNESNIQTIDALNDNIIESVIPLASDKTTLIQIQNNLNYLIDKLEKFSFFLRDTTSTGTNKFNAEIMMYNQVALEMLENKKELRNEYYTKFMKNFFTMTNAMGLTSSNVDDIKVLIAISEMEQIKLDTLKAQAENLRTQKINQKVENTDSNDEKKETDKKDDEK